jgi:uncharacterized protein (TIGR02186 family)
MSMRRLVSAALCVACLAGSCRAAVAERLVTALSNYRVSVSSSFTGVDLVLFGTIEREGLTAGRAGGYDIVVTVMGPRQMMVTRRKDRVFGIWVNVDSRTFVAAPSYLAVLTNRPIDQIAPPEDLRRLQIGLENTVLPQEIGEDIADVSHDDPFRVAFLRLMVQQGLYREQTNAVTFLTPTAFRTTIPVPADAAIGAYEVDVKLFADGALVARDVSAFELYKVGFEQFVAYAAHAHGLLYGLATAGLALLVGWLASVVFRRD